VTTDQPPIPPARTSSRRGPLLIALGLVLLVAILTTAFLATRPDDQATAVPPQPQHPPTTSTPTTTLDPKVEVVSRLREILRVRDRAILTRDADLLRTVYTPDCNCLRDGIAVIERLRREKVKWKGLSTSFTVSKVEAVGKRQWIITGVVSSSSIRIETEEGKLIRLVPRERNYLGFGLAKPPTSSDWLLGHTSLLKDAG
jgi:hypothetical protein